MIWVGQLLLRSKKGGPSISIRRRTQKRQRKEDKKKYLELPGAKLLQLKKVIVDISN